jgi:hypothetical protein
MLQSIFSTITVSHVLQDSFGGHLQTFPKLQKILHHDDRDTQNDSLDCQEEGAFFIKSSGTVPEANTATKSRMLKPTYTRRLNKPP